MKKRAYIYVAFGILLISISCNNSNKNQSSDSEKSLENNSSIVETDNPKPSTDYSSLLINYNCDMTAAEVAKVFDLPETDVIQIDSKQPNRCDFEIKGFGKNAFGGTIMILGSAPFSKADNKKEIQSFLKREKNNENMFGMGIELSETGDCYIARIPHVGRVVIYNENYDGSFYFSFSQKGVYKRTEEQHAALTEKTIALANYLLKKHKK